MKLWQIGKRVALFLFVNILIVTTIGLVLSLFGVGTRLPQSSYASLLAFCFIWGMGGALISLALSRLMAKWFMGVAVIAPDTQDAAQRELVQSVHSLARKAGLTTMPQVGIYSADEVNAFATGPSRSRSLVAVSSGLLNQMRRREVEGVLAHEIAHIANGDMVTMTLIQGVINAFVMFLARVLAFAVSQAIRSRDENRGGGGFIQYLLVMIFQMVFSLLGAVVVCWFSRWREFRADAGGAQLAGREQMIGALTALGRLHDQPPPSMGSDGGQAFQALKISSPPSRMMRWFATHPPLEERIARLQIAVG